MTSQEMGERPEGGFLGLLRVVALVVVLAGAVGSLGLMVLVGHRNPSVLLLALFTVWVLSPFVGLVRAHGASKRWSVPAQAMLYSVMLVLTLGSLVLYAEVAFGPPRAKPAFFFLVVPMVSWLLIAIVVSTAALLSGKRQADARE